MWNHSNITSSSKCTVVYNIQNNELGLEELRAGEMSLEAVDDFTRSSCVSACFNALCLDVVVKWLLSMLWNWKWHQENPVTIYVFLFDLMKIH